MKRADEQLDRNEKQLWTAPLVVALGHVTDVIADGEEYVTAVSQGKSEETQPG